MSRPASSIRGYELVLLVLIAVVAFMLDTRIETLEKRLDGYEHVEGTSTEPVRFQP